MRLGLWVLKGDWCSGLRLASTLVPGLGPSGPLAVSWGQQRAPGPPGSHILLSQVTSLPLWVWQVAQGVSGSHLCVPGHSGYAKAQNPSL